MRVVHICFCGVYTDGFTYQENLLAKYQKKNGHEVTVLTGRFCYDPTGKLVLADAGSFTDVNGVQVIRLKTVGEEKTGQRFFRMKDFLPTLTKLCPEIIFVHGLAFSDTDRLAEYAAQHPEVRMYVDNHADFSNSATNWLSKNILHRIIWKRGAKKLEPYVRRFYGVLPARVDFLVQMYDLPPEKCSLLVMGADDELAETARQEQTVKDTRARYGLRDDTFLIVTGGKIDVPKIQTLLLMRAVKKLAQERKDRDLKLIIFGSVEEALKPEFESLLGPDCIRYIGWIGPKDAYALFAAAQLCVFPGRHSVYWEEASGTGTPLIVKDWEGTRHVDLGGNVIFLKKDDASEIEQALVSVLYEEGVYQSMKAVAEEKGVSCFSYRNIARMSIEDQ